MTHPAVKRLHNDLHRLHVAREARAHDARELRHDERALKQDQRDLAHHKDAFEDRHKDLEKARAALGRVRTREHDALDALKARKTELQAQYDASIDPATGQGDPAIQAQLDDVAQQEAAVHARFDPVVTADREKVDALKRTVDRTRQAIHQDRRDIARDRREIHHDKRVLAHDKARVTSLRHKALHDLRPAEFHMGLKATNHARTELGLKPVDHVIRPDDPHHVTPEMRRLASSSMDVARSMGGYVSGGRCAAGVSAALRRAMGISVWGNGNQIDDNLPRSRFKQVHMPLSEALKIPGLILTWEHTSTSLGRIYGHTAVTTGDGHTSTSDFIERDTLAGNRSRTGLKIFMPI